MIFNVGASLSSYLEVNSKRIVVDLGSSDDFSPTNDFLIPLFERRQAPKNTDNQFEIDQLFLSHPHNDHISDIRAFHKRFYPKLITVPNNNEGNLPKDMINWDLIDNPSDEYVRFLRERVLPGPKASSNFL